MKSYQPRQFPLPALLGLLGAVALSAWLHAGCGTIEGAEGTPGGPCRADGTCDAGLACVNGTCETLACQSTSDCPSSGGACTLPACEAEACELLPVDDGQACPRSGTICVEGSCLAGCYIGAQFYGNGEHHPEVSCLHCDSLQRTSTWTPDCEAGLTCFEDDCIPGCVIDGEFYEPDAEDPASACFACDPFADPVDWTDGCGTGTVCAEGGACIAGCRIGGQLYSPGAANPVNACQRCDPDESTKDWSVAAGAACDDGLFCTVNTQCDAEGVCGGGAPRDCSSMSQGCQVGVCREQSQSCAQEQLPEGSACGGGRVCNAAGQCVDPPDGCTPATCNQLGLNCGQHGDGCGGTISCGGCSTFPNSTCQSGHCVCNPSSCGALGVECGTHDSGCGGTVNCGQCSAFPNSTCQAGQCVCTPNTCQGLGVGCGVHDNGCGGTVNCGACTLSVARTGDGSGTVTSAPGGISCGGTCTATFSFNQSVTLSQSASTGVFTGWSGDCTGQGACTVTMTHPRSVEARFSQVYDATVFVNGRGTVIAPDITCGDGAFQCSTSYVSGTQVTFFASASPGESFLGWGGACSGTSSSCTLTISGFTFVTADFTCVGAGGGPECPVF